MFKVAVNPGYKAIVTVMMPNEECGNDTSKFKVFFKRFSVEELEGEGGLRSLPQAEVLKKAITGWSELVADDGTEFTFSAHNLEILLSIPQVLKVTAETFWITQYGAKQKN